MKHGFRFISTLFNKKNAPTSSVSKQPPEQNALFDKLLFDMFLTPYFIRLRSMVPHKTTEP